MSLMCIFIDSSFYYNYMTWFMKVFVQWLKLINKYNQLYCVILTTCTLQSYFCVCFCYIGSSMNAPLLHIYIAPSLHI